MHESVETNPTTDERDNGAPVDAEPSDRRRAARQTLVTKGMLFPHATPAAPRRVFISNISLLGVGFRTPTPFEVGDRYRLKVEAGPMQMQSHLQVVDCRPHDEKTFEVGAQFVPTELNLPGAYGRRAESVPRNPSRHLRPRA
ncbi:MAG: PilZ domain-containing protein [Tepidisphaeraceae bacterium]